jgi:uncharacterized protein (DUF1697 family)
MQDMSSYIALLHSIGIGGNRRLRMSDWREMMQEISLLNVRTLGATGNALFDGQRASARLVEQRLERAFESTFGRHVDVIVRPAAAFRRLVAGNPFPAESRSNGAQVVVRIMREPLLEQVLLPLRRFARNGERLALVGGDLWVHFAHPPSRSRLLPVLTTQRLGVGTIRNWNTVRRLNELLGEP